MNTKYTSILLAGLLAAGVTVAQAETGTTSPTPNMDRSAPVAIPPAVPDTNNGTWSTPEQDQDRNPRLDPPSSPSGDLENPEDSSKPLDSDVMDGTENDGSN